MLLDLLEVFEGSGSDSTTFLDFAPMVYRTMVLLSLLAGVVSGGSTSSAEVDPSAVTYNERSAVLHGTPTLMLSGAIHYTRVLPADWSRVLDLAVEMGLNTIQTYVMWNFHEQQRGTVEWGGRRNITHFIDLAAQRNLNGCGRRLKGEGF